MNPSVDLSARLLAVRSHDRATPWIPPCEDASPLLRSWQRCRDAGMREHEQVSFELVSRAQLAGLDEAHSDLVCAARPEAERLARSLRGSGCAVLLFNARGTVIDRLCHEAALPAPLLQATRKGVNVDERCVGTTAPAIALAEGMPYLVGRDAHFFANLRPFFCVAAPIDGPDGQRLGALDITAYDRVPAFDLYALVVDAAAAIENSLFGAVPERLLLRFHPRAELVGTALEGLLDVDGDGRVCGANRVAARLLCQPRAGLIGQAFAALFDRRLQSLFARPASQRADLVELQTQAGLQVQARFESAAPRLAADTAVQALRPAAPGASLRELERRTIERTLAALDGNVSETARQLGISRNTIYRRRSGREA